MSKVTRKSAGIVWIVVELGQIFIQNGPSEVVGLTQQVLVLTNLSPHHIFRSRFLRFYATYRNHY